MAQPANVEIALTRMNELLGGEVRMSCNDQQELMIIRSNAYGIVQKDQVTAAQLDAEAMRWDVQGELLVPCSSQYKHCVGSVNFKLDQERRSSTLRLPAVLHDHAQGEFAAALRDLIAAMAMENELVVTSSPTQRMTEDYLKHDL